MPNKLIRPDDPRISAFLDFAETLDFDGTPEIACETVHPMIERLLKKFGPESVEEMSELDQQIAACMITQVAADMFGLLDKDEDEPFTPNDHAYFQMFNLADAPEPEDEYIITWEDYHNLIASAILASMWIRFKITPRFGGEE